MFHYEIWTDFTPKMYVLYNTHAKSTFKHTTSQSKKTIVQSPWILVGQIGKNVRTTVALPVIVTCAMQTVHCTRSSTNVKHHEFSPIIQHGVHLSAKVLEFFSVSETSERDLFCRHRHFKFMCCIPVIWWDNSISKTVSPFSWTTIL